MPRALPSLLSMLQMSLCTPKFLALLFCFSPLLSFPCAFATRRLAPGSEIEVYYPRSVFQTYGSGYRLSYSFLRNITSPRDIALSFLKSEFNTDENATAHISEFSSELCNFLYFSQSYNGIPVSNLVSHISLSKEYELLAFSSSFRTLDFIPSPRPTVAYGAIVHDIENLLGGKARPVPERRLEYLAVSDTEAALVWVFEVQNLRNGVWYEVFVDAHSGKLRSLVNFVAHASYRALPIHKASLQEGQELMVGPEDLIASPLGWHNDGTANTTFTLGNNVQSFRWLDPGYQYTESQLPEPTLLFDYPAQPQLPPSSNVDAARTNAFYVLNVMHDLSWRYGFTEDAFNFQTKNLGGRGAVSKGNDPVRVSIQAEGVGENNAFFASPADGTPGFCYMLLWTHATPNRDGALANDILVHEFTHGITNRMTGGGTSRCLQTIEAQGLGEGWSDIMAEWTELTSANISDYVFAAYVADTPGGLRRFPYSTDAKINPLRYSHIADLVDPHDIGEIWGNILHIILAVLLEKYGFSLSAMRDPSTAEGNVIFLHLFMDALPLQPCNPTFTQARDAIIQADQIRYGGVNMCLLWAVFASRGLGMNALDDYTEDETVPEECRESALTLRALKGSRVETSDGRIFDHQWIRSRGLYHT